MKSQPAKCQYCGGDAVPEYKPSGPGCLALACLFACALGSIAFMLDKVF